MKENENKKTVVRVTEGNPKETANVLQDRTQSKADKLKKPLIFGLMGINSPSEEKASSFLNLVSVSNNKEAGNVIFKTNINPSYSKFKLSNALSKDKSKETNLRIDYVVYMPQENELNLNNSFGDVYLPEFSSVLNLNQSYGVLYADNISNGLSKVSVNFGKANIHSMNGGDLRSN